MGDCLVTNATDAPFVRDIDWAGTFEHAGSEVMLTLNCNRGAATATTPGASMGSPEGREFQAAAEEKAAEEQAAAEQAQQAELAAAGETPGERAEVPTG